MKHLFNKNIWLILIIGLFIMGPNYSIAKRFMNSRSMQGSKYGEFMWRSKKVVQLQRHKQLQKCKKIGNCKE